VVRTGTGYFDVYFEKPMDNINYCPLGNTTSSATFDLVSGNGGLITPILNSINKVKVCTSYTAGLINAIGNFIEVKGGKN